MLYDRYDQPIAELCRSAHIFWLDVSLELEQRHWHNSDWAENEVSTTARLVTAMVDESRVVQSFPLVKASGMRWDMVGSIEL